MERALFSSAKDAWATPKAVYDALDAEFHFDFDPCPLNTDASWEDGTKVSWAGKRVFCNPPYGPGIKGFLAKATEAKVAVYLLPSRTDTKWWHEYAMKADEIRFLKGRLKFGGSKNSAPFPSVVLIYGVVPDEATKDFEAGIMLAQGAAHERFHRLRTRLATLEALVAEWRKWYNEEHGYKTRVQLEEMTNAVLTKCS